MGCVTPTVLSGRIIPTNFGWLTLAHNRQNIQYTRRVKGGISLFLAVYIHICVWGM